MGGTGVDAAAAAVEADVAERQGRRRLRVGQGGGGDDCGDVEIGAVSRHIQHVVAADNAQTGAGGPVTLAQGRRVGDDAAHRPVQAVDGGDGGGKGGFEGVVVVGAGVGIVGDAVRGAEGVVVGIGKQAQHQRARRPSLFGGDEQSRVVAHVVPAVHIVEAAVVAALEPAVVQRDGVVLDGHSRDDGVAESPAAAEKPFGKCGHLV